jgi:integrase
MPAIPAPRCVPKPVTQDELRRSLLLPEPYRTAVILAAFAGLRASEIAGCRREHITDTTVTVPHGKGDEPGTVPAHPYVWDHVRDRPPGPLVTDRHGRAVTGRWLSSRMRIALDRAALRGVHLHRYRHWYGTMVQEMTGDLRVTQECLRHRHVGSTAGYTLVTSARRAAAVAALPVPETRAGV